MSTTATVIAAITAVFTAIFDWLATALSTVIAVFYAEGSLTFLGVLAVIALGISIFFLIMGVISNFLHLRG